MFKKALWILGIGLIGLSILLVFNTLRLPSKQLQVKTVKFKVNAQQLAENLGRSIQFQTISYQDPKRFQGKTFEAFHKYLEKTFPQVQKLLQREIVSKYSLLYTWRGSNSALKPYLLMGHLDVVPIAKGTERDWKHPPYSGRLADGAVWGRGTLDDKAAVMGSLEAVEALLREKFKPQRTLYLAFGHDEEIGGNDGAKEIAALLKKRGVELEYVLDEGLVITHGIMPGTKKPVALIGLGEKGYLTLKLTVKTKGGHSSIPPKHTSIGLLSSAVHRLEHNPMPARLQEPMTYMLSYIGPELDFTKKLAFANVWLFRPLLLKLFTAKASTNASIRTTTAVTMFNSGIKENVIPIHASIFVNFRILPGDRIQNVIHHVERVIQDKRIQISIPNHKLKMEPSPISSTEGVGFKVVQRTIHEIFPNTIVGPGLVLGGTDSRHFSTLSKNIYRFLPISYTSSDSKRFHGTNERILINNYANLVCFFQRLIQNSQK